jgi:non-heme chloroperoxidase
MQFFVRIALLAVVPLTVATGFANTLPFRPEPPTSSWHDASPTVQFVTVDKDVKLEVLDWGGSGRPMVFLSGLGNSAHVFDEFAPKFTSQYHVYGITRRGYGASSVPPVSGSNYSADRLGDDVLAVMDALKIEKAVLVGHSIAGEELSSVATRHPERVAGLIYLDAGYFYAYYNPAAGPENVTIDLTILQRAAAKLEASPTDHTAIDEMLNEDLPAVENDLREMQKMQPDNVPARPQPPPPSATDNANCHSFVVWEQRVVGYREPDSECQQLHVFTWDGHVGPLLAKPETTRAVVAGEQKYTNIPVPILAIFALPHDPGLFYHTDPMLKAWEDRDLELTGAFVDAFQKGNPSARVVRLPGASHYVFLTNEADVLREMRAFLRTLP